jgi:hypothetical protein
VRGQAPKVPKQEKKKKPTGRAMKRIKYNRRFVNVGEWLFKRVTVCRLWLTDRLTDLPALICVPLQWSALARSAAPTASKAPRRVC